MQSPPSPSRCPPNKAARYSPGRARRGSGKGGQEPRSPLVQAPSGCDPRLQEPGPAEFTFRHGEGEFPMMEAPDSLCVVLIGGQAALKGLSRAIPPCPRGARAESASAGREGAAGEAVIHQGTAGGAACITRVASERLQVCKRWVLLPREPAAACKRRCRCPPVCACPLFGHPK